MVNLARVFMNEGKFPDFQRTYPIDGSKEEKLHSPLADSLRGKTLSVIRLDGNSIESSSVYNEVIEHARAYIRAEHGSVFAVEFELDGVLYACIVSENANNSTGSHVEINTRDNLDTVCDAAYNGNGITLTF